nr:glycosyltransferase family 61 protein [Methylobacterium sp. BTF04]
MAPPDAAPVVADAERHLFIGPLVTHYGHFLVGTLARLWPLLTWDGPKPRLLCPGLGPAASRPPLPFLDVILGHFGLSMDDLVDPEHPTRIADLILPGPSLKEQAFAHAVHGDLARAIGQPFWETDEVDTVTRPVYLSKSRLKAGISRMRNEDALCDALARRGVDIAFPEALSLPDLVRLMSVRRIVLGTTGSAFHTAVFAAPGRRIVGLNWAPHLNANFPLLDDLNGTRARYYHPAGSESGPEAGFHFGWSVPDPEAVAAELVWRAERFDDLDAIDAAQEAEHRSAARTPLVARLGRWLSRRS